MLRLHQNSLRDVCLLLAHVTLHISSPSALKLHETLNHQVKNDALVRLRDDPSAFSLMIRWGWGYWSFWHEANALEIMNDSRCSYFCNWLPHNWTNYWAHRWNTRLRVTFCRNWLLYGEQRVIFWCEAQVRHFSINLARLGNFCMAKSVMSPSIHLKLLCSLLFLVNG